MPLSVAVAQFARALEWKAVAERDNTGKISTTGNVAKLNFELDRGMGDEVGNANFRGCSAICTRPRVEKL